MSNQLSAHVIVCDDFREEVGGKISLMGMYADRVVCSSFPTSFHSLVFCIRILSHEASEHDFKLHVSIGEDTGGTFEGNLRVAQEEFEGSRSHVHIPVRIPPFIVKREGLVKIELVIDGETVVSDGLEIVADP